MRHFLGWGRKAAQQLAVGFGITLATVLFCFLALEIGLRAWDNVPISSVHNFIAAELDQIHRPGGGSADYDSRVGWVQRSNLAFPHFTTGEYGARMSGEKIVPLQQNAVLVVGDSFGAGSEVGNSESWPAALERALGSQVINAAVGGYGLDQIVLRAEMLVPLLKPRVLLVQGRLEYGLSLNRMSVISGAPKPFFTVQDGRLVLQNQPVPRLAASPRDIGWMRSILGYSYLVHFTIRRLGWMQWWLTEKSITWETSQDESLKVSCLLLHRLSELRDKYKMKVSLVMQYSGVDALDDKLRWASDRDTVAACAKDENLPVVDTWNALRTVFKTGGIETYRKLWVMHDNNTSYGHMSAEGNALVAEVVSQAVFRDGAAADEMVDQKSK